MAKDLNVIIVAGNLTKTPEVKTGESTGNSYCKFSVAVGRDKEHTDFFDCCAFKGTAEFIGKYFTKGQKIIITGRLQQETYTNADGVKRSTCTIMVSEASFGSAKAESATETTTPAQDKPKGQSFSATQNNFEEVNTDDDIPF